MSVVVEELLAGGSLAFANAYYPVENSSVMAELAAVPEA